MRSTILILFSFCLVGQVAGALKIPVAENNNVEVTLSRNNINRLLVSHDKITQARYPEGAFSIDKTSPDGSVYATNLQDKPFTLFLTTARGRHFSVTVKSREGLGETIAFTPPQYRRVVRKSKPLSRKQQLASTVGVLLKGEIPKGFSVIKGAGTLPTVKAGLHVTPVSRLASKSLTVDVFDIKNLSRRKTTLKERDFKRGGVSAVALSSALLAPHQTSRLFIIKRASHG